MANVKYEELTVRELREICKKKGMTNYSKKPKPVLLEMLGVGAKSMPTTEVDAVSFNDLSEDGFAEENSVSKLISAIVVKYGTRTDFIAGPMSVSDIRSQTKCSPPENATAYIGGPTDSGDSGIVLRENESSVIVENGQKIEFSRPQGDKGGWFIG